MLRAAAYKLGSWQGKLAAEAPQGLDQEHKYGHRFISEKTAGPDRLTIGADHDTAKLILSLAEHIPGQLYVLYILKASRTGADSARYQSPSLNHDELAEFIWTFSEFLQRDARHDLWVGAIEGSELLVLDSHGLIYAYGLQQQFADVLRDSGLVEGVVEIPAPHTHHYHVQFDSDEESILGYFPWEKYLLTPDDFD